MIDAPKKLRQWKTVYLPNLPPHLLIQFGPLFHFHFFSNPVLNKYLRRRPHGFSRRFNGRSARWDGTVTQTDPQPLAELYIYETYCLVFTDACQQRGRLHNGRWLMQFDRIQISLWAPPPCLDSIHKHNSIWPLMESLVDSAVKCERRLDIKGRFGK